mmetsp:Transcript_57919/g.113978  ORF Transcript_57919/g.113978 Transcript_57919/m.113978 type:complete len:146 (-) Transcript_57919:72-509(-)
MTCLKYWVKCAVSCLICFCWMRPLRRRQQLKRRSAKPIGKQARLGVGLQRGCALCLAGVSCAQWLLELIQLWAMQAKRTPANSVNPIYRKARNSVAGASKVELTRKNRCQSNLLFFSKKLPYTYNTLQSVFYKTEFKNTSNLNLN